MRISLSISFLLLFAGFYSFGQIRCYTEKMPQEPEEVFENWLSEKITLQKVQRILRTEAVVQIPVVVHILHNGEAYGTGRNIPDEQVFAQIQVINEDFRRTNPDAVNTPSEFVGVAADVEIEFVLAKQDPEGLPTNGIVRVNSGQDTWSWSEQTLMKNKSYWPQEDYLNIWVADLQLDGFNLLGYATYPQTGLPGIPFRASPNNDGVSIDYTVFGSVDYYPQGTYNSNFNKGRTMTHELGHFFGLRHIWGDGFCGNDYCDDTPTQGSDTSGCPSGTRDSCGSNDMYMNYMDYTHDACMNIFTTDQKDRMLAVLNNSPRRSLLANSHALNDPVITANDAGFTTILSPSYLACPGTIIPQVELRNYGSNSITSVQVRLKLDGNTLETKTFTTNLNYLDKYVADFSEITPISGNYEFEILTVNGSPDSNPLKNTISTNTTQPQSASLPYFEDFESGMDGWISINPDEEIDWTIVSANNGSPGNDAMRMEFHQYENMGELDFLISPVFDLSSAESPFLQFDVAYRSYTGSENDALMVAIINNCQFDIDSPMGLAFDTVYYKAATDLATLASSTSYFVPNGSGDWRSESAISLNEYKGQSHIQVVFASNNGWGNNLYLDNIQVNPESNLDIELSSVSAPGRITCESTFTPSILVFNSGTEVISSFSLAVSFNGETPQVFNYTGVNLINGQSVEALLPEVGLPDGDYLLEAEITAVNGTIDPVTSNNVLSYEFRVDTQVILPPDRELFNDTMSQTWSSFSESSLLDWASFNQSIRVASFANPNLGNESWLLSPAYDFSSLEEAGIFFDVAYSNLPAGDETLYFIASNSCGTRFEEVFYIKSGDNLSTAAPVTDFEPNDNDWRQEYVDLSSLAGESNVRLAFVMVNGGGNNIYLDNLELFVEDDPDPLKIESEISGPYPNPTSDGKLYLTFNLPEKENVSIRIYNSLGRQVYLGELSPALNQTIELNLRDQSQGIYIVEVIADNFRKSWRIMNSR